MLAVKTRYAQLTIVNCNINTLGNVRNNLVITQTPITTLAKSDSIIIVKTTWNKDWLAKRTDITQTGGIV